MTANTLFPTSILESICRGLSFVSPLRVIVILPGNTFSESPASILPDLTHILSAYKCVNSLVVSKTRVPNTVKLTNLGGSTSIITLYAP